MNVPEFKPVSDLTTNGIGVHSDSEPLVARIPKILQAVPGLQWTGKVGQANALIRLPNPDLWNGKLMIGATPAVRTEHSLDLVLGDIVLQQGCAYAACDKGTPMLTLRDVNRSMAEWPHHYRELTLLAIDAVSQTYGTAPSKVYISGVSNGGYVTRVMIERYPELYDGGVEWEGVLWRHDRPNLITALNVWVQQFPVYANLRGDRTAAERASAHEKLISSGLHPDSEPYWAQYFAMYWVLSLWLYGHSLDPAWKGFEQEWNNDWLRDPSALFYPIEERQDVLVPRIKEIVNTGRLTKPLLSVAGNWDCLITYRDNAQAYADLVAEAHHSANHRLYEVPRGNHVDGLLKANPGRQQVVHPFYEATLHYLERWVETGEAPPASGTYENIEQFAPDMDLLTK